MVGLSSYLSFIVFDKFIQFFVVIPYLVDNLNFSPAVGYNFVVQFLFDDVVDFLLSFLPVLLLLLNFVFVLDR